MLIFNNFQIDRIREIEVAKFINRCVDYGYEIEPRLAVLGKEQVKCVAADAVATARTFGLRRNGAVGAWFKASVKLGAAFHLDPQYDDILPDSDPLEFEVQFAIDLDHRVDALSAAIESEERWRTYWDIASQNKLRALKVETIIDSLKLFWPEKVGFLGADKIVRLLQESKNPASAWGIPETNPPVWTYVLPFFLGFGWATDSRFPTLLASSIPSGLSPDARLRLLENRFLTLCKEAGFVAPVMTDGNLP